MHPYTKELTLNEALKLQQLAPNTVVFRPNFGRSFKLGTYDIKTGYLKVGALYCTALDYADHILGQVAPPEGWGYAAYDLSNGKYDKLPYYRFSDEGEWTKGTFDIYEYTVAKIKGIWHKSAFRLEDLARVEGVTETEMTEIDWKAKYEAQAGEIAKFLEMGTENAILKLQVLELEKVIERQRIEINNYCRAADKANEQSNEFWQLLLKSQELNQQYQIALTNLL